MIGMGLYFIIFRPAFLPEDVRYIGLPEGQFDLVKPRLEAWLTHVFRVLGGYVVATGVLTIVLAATSFRDHARSAGIGIMLGGASSIGLMTLVNFALNSDFRWALFSLAVLWAFSLGLFGLEMYFRNRSR